MAPCQKSGGIFGVFRGSESCIAIGDFCNLTVFVEQVMFKHILIPTDGSDLSRIAIENGVKFARELKARITGLTVSAPFHTFAIDAMQVGSSSDAYLAHAEEQAQRNLKVLKDAAAEAGVPCELMHRIGEHPYEEIVKAAQEQNCDVIFQASHGRRGVGALVLGSETNKVLTHSKIPVLVFR
jgi:nucleotide-binding universal stress UspA family protein